MFLRHYLLNLSISILAYIRQKSYNIVLGVNLIKLFSSLTKGQNKHHDIQPNDDQNNGRTFLLLSSVVLLIVNMLSVVVQGQLL